MKLFHIALFLQLAPLSSAALEDDLVLFAKGLPKVHETASFLTEKVSPAWDPQKFYAPPIGSMILLGQFKSGEVASLSIKNLPEHDRILIRVEIAILCHWDGVWESYGKDSWKAAIKDGPVLLETTFSNFSRAAQNYPDEIDGNTFPLQTGAQSIADLDFVEELGEHKGGWKDLDATYSIWIAAEHSSPSVVLEFSGNFHDDPDKVEDWGLEGENWCIKSCDVWVVPEKETIDEEVSANAASQLFTEKTAPEPAYNAILLLSGSDVFPKIQKSLKHHNLNYRAPGKGMAEMPSAEETFQKIIGNLASDEFQTRKLAARELIFLLPESMPLFVETIKSHKDPEVVFWLTGAIKKFQKMENQEAEKPLLFHTIVSKRIDRLLRLMTPSSVAMWWKK